MNNFLKTGSSQPVPDTTPLAGGSSDFLARSKAIDDESRRKLPDMKRGAQEADDDATRRLRELGRIGQ